MKLTWLGHSCFKIESREGSAVLDTRPAMFRG